MVPGAADVNGLYALASLDGAPLRPRDLAVLGLPAGSGPMACAARDPDRAAIDLGDDSVFLGYLNEPKDIAAVLGRPATTSHAELAAAAIAQFGDEAPSRLLGEWSWLRWDASSRTLTLASSEPVRDDIMFASDGRRVAVAPDIHTLRQLDWVGGTLDPYGLLQHMGRTRRRATIIDETILCGVRRVVHGTRVTIGRDGTRASVRRPWPVPDRWRGSFDDLMAEADSLLGHILDQHMRRHPRIAILLSGGLDSSLLAAYAASTQGARASLFGLTSAAAADSELDDEVTFARTVADRAGFPLQPVVPGDDVGLYRPSARTLGWLQQPLAAPAHYLYDALFAESERGGATAVFDGGHGELTLTGYAPAAPWWSGPGAAVRAALALARESDRMPRPLQQEFHPRLAASALDLARTSARRRAPGVTPEPWSDDRTLWGYLPGATKVMRESSGTPWPGLRRIMPFRDRRLLELFAAMPVSFIVRDGLGRAPARHLLQGRVPDSVRLRARGMPFSPDYFQRAHRDAAAARTRIAGHARVGADEWIDLKWLDNRLRTIERDVPTSIPLIFEVQATAIAAEFLRAWIENTNRGGGR